MVPAAVAGVVGAVLALGGAALVAHGLTGSQGPPRPAAGPAATATAHPRAAPTSGTVAATSPANGVTATATPSARDFGPMLGAATPVSLDVPAIDVHADHLVDLAYDADGGLEVPKDFDDVGWFTPGPSPGQLGPAVIAGHVDSTAGSAVFYRLGELRRGNSITVGRDDGTTARFVVDAVHEYPKDQFPTAEVYGNTTSRAELRLLTCGGDFDHRTGHYVDNVVVFAHLVR
jgi:hypothetical protein